MVAAGLHAADLPAGWDAQAAHSGDVGDDVLEQNDLRACAGMSDNSSKVTERAESDNFSSEPFDIWSLTTQYRASADNDVRALVARPKFARCFALLAKRGYTGAAPIGTVIGKVTVTLVKGADGGPRNVAGSVTARTPVNDHGDRFSFYDTVVFCTGRGLESELYFSGQGRPVPARLRRRLVELVAARTASA